MVPQNSLQIFMSGFNSSMPSGFEFKVFTSTRPVFQSTKLMIPVSPLIYLLPGDRADTRRCKVPWGAERIWSKRLKANSTGKRDGFMLFLKASEMQKALCKIWTWLVESICYCKNAITIMSLTVLLYFLYHVTISVSIESF